MRASVSAHMALHALVVCPPFQFSEGWIEIQVRFSFGQKASEEPLSPV